MKYYSMKIHNLTKDGSIVSHIHVNRNKIHNFPKQSSKSGGRKKNPRNHGGQKHSIKMVGDTTVNMIGIKHESYKRRSENRTLPPELRRAMDEVLGQSGKRGQRGFLEADENEKTYN